MAGNLARFFVRSHSTFLSLVIGLVASWPLAVLAQPAPSFDWHSGKTELVTGWRTHSGDNLAWASPNFDDSAWDAFGFTRLPRWIISSAPTRSWYRIRLHLPDAPHDIAILVAGTSGEYELYVNGVLQPGSRLRSKFTLAQSSQVVFPLDTARGDVELALRTRVPALYDYGPPVSSVFVGTQNVLTAQAVADHNFALNGCVLPEAIYLLLAIAGMAILVLYRAQPTHGEYLWLGLCLLSIGINIATWFASMVAGLLPTSFNTYFADPLTYVWLITQIEFVYSFVGRKPSRAVRLFEAICLLAPLWVNFGQLFFPISQTTIDPVEAIFAIPVALGLPILLTTWYRRGNREAGWLIFPLLLTSASVATLDIGFTLGGLGLFPAHHDLVPPLEFGPYRMDFGSVANLLFLISITVVIFLRFTRVSREQSRIQAELSAAQELQSRLVPATPPPVTGFAFQAVYLPATEVGGDFYQVFPQSDESALIVVGDVSGKGLRAAMTGTLVLGGLRALVQESLSPSQVLSRLNNQLATSSDGGFVTCLCARIAPDGLVTLANAGHLAPYRNGAECELDSGLPLGIAANVDYTETILQLNPGDTLTLMSDGVVEAQDAGGELFGFERTQAISNQSAEEIAAAAQQFGQQDDISVLTIAFAPIAVLQA
jgi:phosphoserine phosphatase RsbU/P